MIGVYFRDMTGKYRRFFLAAVSLLLAIAAWFMVVAQKTYQTSLFLPLNMKGLSPKLVLANKIPSAVHVVVSGSGKELISEILTPAPVILNADNFTYGRKKISTKDLEYRFITENITLVNVISPKEIELNIDRKVTNTVPVKSALVLKAAPGMVVAAEPTFEPKEVTIEGPESILNGIREIFTKPDTFLNLNISTSLLAVLEPPDETVKPIADTITAFVRIEQLVQRKIENVHVQVLNMPARIGTFLPAEISVTLAGAKNTIDTISASNLSVIVNYAEKSEISATVKPTVVVEPSITVVSTEPEYLEFIPAKGAR